MTISIQGALFNLPVPSEFKTYADIAKFGYGLITNGFNNPNAQILQDLNQIIANQEKILNDLAELLSDSQYSEIWAVVQSSLATIDTNWSQLKNQTQPEDAWANGIIAYDATEDVYSSQIEQGIAVLQANMGAENTNLHYSLMSAYVGCLRSTGQLSQSMFSAAVFQYNVTMVELVKGTIMMAAACYVYNQGAGNPPALTQKQYDDLIAPAVKNINLIKAYVDTLLTGPQTESAMPPGTTPVTDQSDATYTYPWNTSGTDDYTNIASSDNECAFEGTPQTAPDGNVVTGVYWNIGTPVPVYDDLENPVGQKFPIGLAIRFAPLLPNGQIEHAKAQIQQTQGLQTSSPNLLTEAYTATRFVVCENTFNSSAPTGANFAVTGLQFYIWGNRIALKVQGKQILGQSGSFSLDDANPLWFPDEDYDNANWANGVPQALSDNAGYTNNYEATVGALPLPSQALYGAALTLSGNRFTFSLLQSFNTTRPSATAG